MKERGPEVPAEYEALIAGERVSERTRKVLEERMAGPKPGAEVLTAEQERTLRAVLARVVPQRVGAAIDLSGFVVERLASGKGDGWRYAVLPGDVAAYREGLDRLTRVLFADKSGEEQDALLRELEQTAGSAEARWFEEVRGDATAAYMAHPATLARIGYSGIGVGGAATKNKGFVRIGVDEREAWEPVAAGGSR